MSKGSRKINSRETQNFPNLHTPNGCCKLGSKRRAGESGRRREQKENNKNIFAKTPSKAVYFDKNRRQNPPLRDSNKNRVFDPQFHCGLNKTMPHWGKK